MRAEVSDDYPPQLSLMCQAGSVPCIARRWATSANLEGIEATGPAAESMQDTLEDLRRAAGRVRSVSLTCVTTAPRRAALRELMAYPPPAE